MVVVLESVVEGVLVVAFLVVLPRDAVVGDTGSVDRETVEEELNLELDGNRVLMGGEVEEEFLVFVVMVKVVEVWELVDEVIT